jgi:mevalonate kinase
MSQQSALTLYLQLRQEIYYLEAQIKEIEPHATIEAVKLLEQKQNIAQTQKHKKSMIFLDTPQLQGYVQYRKITAHDEELVEMQKELKKRQTERSKSHYHAIKKLEEEIASLKNDHYSWQLLELINDLKNELTQVLPVLNLKFK